MKVNPLTVLLMFVFIIPLIRGFIRGFSSKNYKIDIKKNCIDIAFIVALFLGGFLSNKIFIDHNEGIYKKIYEAIPLYLTSYIGKSNLFVYLLIFPLTVVLIYQILFIVLYFFCNFTFFKIIDLIHPKMREGNSIAKRLLGMLVKLPRAIMYILIVTFCVNMYSLHYSNKTLTEYTNGSKLYNIICKEIILPATKTSIAKQIPNIINNSLRIQIKNGTLHNTVILYNGVTLESGVQSNQQIDAFARQLTNKDKDNYSESKILYKWIGKSIRYDDEKANNVLKDNIKAESGAIITFNTRKGICFDYACLFVAMCRANNIKVRMITGEGFNGVSWVSHAWNQVYVVEEKRWINVDTTFSQGGNYFDSKNFNADHKGQEIAGEW